jgi:hypothetical protein
MIFAQSLGEYGVTGGVIGQFARGVESGAEWIQLSLREDRAIWIAAGLCLVLGLWLTRRR